MDFLDLICLNSAAAPEPKGGNFYLLDKFLFVEMIISHIIKIYNRVRVSRLHLFTITSYLLPRQKSRPKQVKVKSE